MFEYLGIANKISRSALDRRLRYNDIIKGFEEKEQHGDIDIAPVDLNFNNFEEDDVENNPDIEDLDDDVEKKNAYKEEVDTLSEFFQGHLYKKQSSTLNMTVLTVWVDGNPDLFRPDTFKPQVMRRKADENDKIDFEWVNVVYAQQSLPESFAIFGISREYRDWQVIR